MSSPDTRHFLFLQGPHGPFFRQLGRMLIAAGAKVWRVGFNAGDRAFWPKDQSFVAFTGALESWEARLAELITEKAITDIVLYGDTRPIHAKAVAIARARGLTVHVFEEGYLRPYWVTYERGGRGAGRGWLPALTRPWRAARPALEPRSGPAGDLLRPDRPERPRRPDQRKRSPARGRSDKGRASDRAAHPPPDQQIQHRRRGAPPRAACGAAHPRSGPSRGRCLGPARRG